MIQRIQTVFLILAALTSVVIFFLPLASFSVSGYSFDIFITGVRNLESDSPLDFKINMLFHLIIFLVIILVILASIFTYKNRILQMKLCRFGIMVNIVFTVLIFMFTDTVKKSFVSTLMIDPESILVKFGAGSIMPLIILIFFFLALKFIKKDEMLVKSADRLR